MMMKLLVFLAISYGILVAVMYSAQDWLVFPGTRLASRPLDNPITPERLSIESDNGDRLAGMLFVPGEGDASNDLLIGFGGNAQDAEILGQDLARIFPKLHIAVFHYRGYGPSTGTPSEHAVLDDASKIYDHLIEALQPGAIYAVGISLGSGVAAHLSKARSLAGMVLVTPYDSIAAVAAQQYPYLPVSLLLNHRFDTIDRMAANDTPVAIIAAEHDQVIKPARTDVLRRHIRRLVFDRTIDGAGHGDIHEMVAYEQALAAALDVLIARNGAKALGTGTQ